MHIEVIRDADGLRRIGSQWERFITGTRNDIPFNHWIWFETLWTNMDLKKWNVFILTAWEDDRLMGVGAMQSAARNLLGIKYTEFKGLENILTEKYSWLLPENETMAKQVCGMFLDYLRKESGGRYMLTWKNTYFEDESFKIFQSVLAQRKHFLTIRSKRYPILVNFPPKSEEILPNLGKKHKKGMQRKRKRYESMGGEVSYHNHPESDLTSRLEQCWDLEAASWKGLLGTAIAQHADLRTFLDQIAPEFIKRNKFLLVTMYHENNLVAFSYCLLDKETLYGIKISYHSAYHKLSPGAILIHYTLEWARANGHQKANLCGDSQDWKTAWSKETYRAGQMVAISQGLPSKALYFYRYGWKDWLKKHRSLIRLRDWWNQWLWKLMQEHDSPNSARDHLIIKLGRKFRL